MKVTSPFSLKQHFSLLPFVINSPLFPLAPFPHRYLFPKISNEPWSTQLGSTNISSPKSWLCRVKRLQNLCLVECSFFGHKIVCSQNQQKLRSSVLGWKP
ncbi:hypothetical protein VNO77_41391 [Canavalia gladiata]|uniref:Uncharacterized protein n=1 Tax=Canavalia gladiata TaxID=3824 RepID=A0AAN9JYN6_CANGL